MGIKNLGTFQADLKKFKDHVDGVPTIVAKKILFDVHARVTNKTPVDTGRARGNWFPSVGAPSTKVDENATRPVNRGSHLPARIPQNEKLYITNNLPYIARLNDGYSKKQAPAAFVETAVAEALAAIKDESV